jgi:hypothetical protein
MIIGLCFILTLEALFPNVDLADLSHLGELWSHFQKHRVDTPEMAFSEFLRLHYEDPEHFDSAPKDHQGLPFSKRQHQRVPTLQLACEIVLITTQTPYIVLMKIEGVADCITFVNGVTSQIWQPPRAKAAPFFRS